MLDRDDTPDTGDAEELPPISRSVGRALALLAMVAAELAEAAECSSASLRDEYRALAPKLDRLERFDDASDEHVNELRGLLDAALNLRDRIGRA